MDPDRMTSGADDVKEKRARNIIGLFVAENNARAGAWVSVNGTHGKEILVV